jgi:hypothetical protein
MADDSHSGNGGVGAVRRRGRRGEVELTGKQAARFLGVNPNTIKRLSDEGHLKMRVEGAPAPGETSLRTRYYIPLAEVMALKAKVDAGTLSLRRPPVSGANRASWGAKREERLKGLVDRLEAAVARLGLPAGGV